MLPLFKQAEGKNQPSLRDVDDGYAVVRGAVCIRDMAGGVVGGGLYPAGRGGTVSEPVRQLGNGTLGGTVASVACGSCALVLCARYVDGRGIQGLRRHHSGDGRRPVDSALALASAVCPVGSPPGAWTPDALCAGGIGDRLLGAGLLLAQQAGLLPGHQSRITRHGGGAASAWPPPKVSHQLCRMVLKRVGS